MSTSTIKSIRFRGVIESSGIVNFDGKPSWMLKQAMRDRFGGKWGDNIKVAKHAFTQEGVDSDGKPILKAVLKISKDCIRQAIFKDDQPFHNPGIVHAEKHLIKLLTSAAGLLRGYMFTEKGIKSKSSVTISEAVQISNNVSSIDIGTMNAPKDKKESADEPSGLTMHFKETIGGIVRYEFEGAIDLSELQFISLSQMYDRLAVDPNHLEAYLQGLSITLGSNVNSKAYYIKNTAVNGLPEEGILLNSDQVKVLIEAFFKRLLDLEILRGASGRAWLSKLEVMPKEKGLINGNWVAVSDATQITSMIAGVHTFYTEYDEVEAKKLYESIDIGKETIAAVKSDKKASKAKKPVAASTEDATTNI